MFEQAIEKKREKMIYFAERYGMTSQKNSGLRPRTGQTLKCNLACTYGCSP